MDRVETEQATPRTMELFELLLRLVIVVVSMICLTGILVLDRSHLAHTRREFRERARIALPFLGLLGVVLLFNAQFRVVVREISWVIGINITPQIHRLEGRTIIHIQSLFGEQFSLFFTYVYVYGYVFLLVFPLLAYFLLPRLDTFKSLTLAYSLNYAIGLVLYAIFLAYGPRNMISPDVSQFFHPQFQLLTTEINENTNVFPSLHTSLSATVMFFAWQTREKFPWWLLIASFFGLSIIISTMYLGIHWVVDVIGGLVLAWVSYWLANRAIEEKWLDDIDARKRVNDLRASLR